MGFPVPIAPASITSSARPVKSQLASSMSLDEMRRVGWRYLQRA